MTHDERMITRLPRKLKLQLRHVAQTERKTLSAITRKLLIEALAAKEQRQSPINQG